MIMQVDMNVKWGVDLHMVMTGLMVVMLDAHLVAMVLLVNCLI